MQLPNHYTNSYYRMESTLHGTPIFSVSITQTADGNRKFIYNNNHNRPQNRAS